MSDAEFIKALQRDLESANKRAVLLAAHYEAAKRTIREIVALNAELEQRVGTMRQIAVAIASNTNKQLRIAAGEKE